MASHASSRVAPSLPLNSLVIIALTAMDRKLIDSRDFGECMPVFQALGGEIKVLTPLISTPTDNTITVSKNKRSRIEISEPNINKTQKTSLTVHPGTKDLQVEVEVVLDINTLSWSALLGPEGMYANVPTHVYLNLRTFYTSALPHNSPNITPFITPLHSSPLLFRLLCPPCGFTVHGGCARMSEVYVRL